MMVIFCPNCQNRLEVPEEFSGEKLQCPYCEVKFIIESEEETLPKIVETAPVIAQAVEDSDDEGIFVAPRPPPSPVQITPPPPAVAGEVFPSAKRNVSPPKKRTGPSALLKAMRALAGLLLIVCAGTVAAYFALDQKKVPEPSVPNGVLVPLTEIPAPEMKDTPPLAPKLPPEPPKPDFKLNLSDPDRQIKDLLNQIAAAEKKASGAAPIEKYIQLMRDENFINTLTRWKVLSQIGEEKLQVIAGRPNGTEFLGHFLNDSEWLSKFLCSGSVDRPGRALELLYLIWNQDAEKRCENESIFQNLATACALNGTDDDYETVQFYRVYQKHYDQGLLHTSFDTLSPEEMRFLVTPDKVSPKSLEYMISQHNTPAGTYGGTCWYAAYRLNNAFGESIHGPNYYKPWDHVYERHENTRKVGGVCGSLSHYGSAAAKAAGIPSTPGGQPGHCAYMVRSLDGVWRIHYYVDFPTGTHFAYWGLWTYSSMPLMEAIFADQERHTESNRCLWLAEALNAERNKPSALFKPVECKVYYGDWSRIPDVTGITPVKTVKSNVFNLEPAGRNEHFALFWSGNIEVMSTTPIEVNLAADDGAKLYINGELQIDNDGMHGMDPSKTAKISLTPGLHPFELRYYQKGGGRGIRCDIKQPPIPFDSSLNDAYQLAVKTQGVNYPAWTAYGSWLQSVSQVPDEIWSNWAISVCEGLKDHQEIAWNLVFKYAAPEIKKRQGRNALLAFFINANNLLKQPTGPQVQEQCVYSNILQNEAKFLDNDKNDMLALFDAALKAHYGSSHNFSNIMSWGSQNFLNDAQYTARFIAAFEKLLSQEGKEDKGLGNFLRDAIRKASQDGNMDVFRQVCDLYRKVSGNPQVQTDNVKFKTPLLSDRGLLQISTTSGYDSPEKYLSVIDGGPNGSFHTGKEKNPWAIVTLPGDAMIDAIYIRNVCTQNNRRAVPLVVSVSEDKVKWKEVFRSDKAENEWKIDLSKKKVKAKYIKAERLDGAAEDFFHLTKFQVHGKKLY